MPKLLSVEVFIFLTQVLVLFTGAKLFGEFARRLRQPTVVGEIVGGVILGPTIFGTFFPDAFHWLFLSANGATVALDGLIFLSAIFLLFSVGLEVDVDTIKQEKKAVAWLGGLGVFIPFVIGLGAGWLLYSYAHVETPRMVFALFAGSALSISVLPIIVRVLLDLDLHKERIGSIIIAVVTINDVLGWILFTFALGLAGSASENMNLWLTIGLTIAFALLAISILRRWVDRFLGFVRMQTNSIVMGPAVFLALAAALFTEYIGVHAVFGAFLIGVTLASARNFPHEARESITHFTANLLAPLFFVSIGLKVNFFNSFDWTTVIIVLVLAYISKLLAARIGGMIAGLTKGESMAVGMAIAARGGMGVILALLALNMHLINEVIFEALVIMSVVTCLSVSLIKRFAVEKNTGEGVV